MGEIFEAIQDGVISSLESETGHWLPTEFWITIDDPAFQKLVSELVLLDTNTPVPAATKRLTLYIQGHRVIVRSSLDPDPWTMEERH